jgi:hypothetical protein
MGYERRAGKRRRTVNSTFSDRGQWSNLIIRGHATIQLKNRGKSKPVLALDLQATRLPLRVKSQTHDKRHPRAATIFRSAKVIVPFDS